jgi:cytochrome c554/c'-like protein
MARQVQLFDFLVFRVNNRATVTASFTRAALLAFLAACSGPRASTRAPDITLFFTAELKGTLEPCGCTSDPLGDIARTAAVVRAADRPAALLDGGSTLYLDMPVPAEKRPQAELTADAVAELLPKLGLAAAGLGPHDLGRGADGVRFPRQAANVTGGAPTAAPRIVDVGGVRVGVFGVVDPAAVAPLGVAAGDPEAAAKSAIAKLRGDGAQLVVALAGLARADARRLARAAPGIDLLLVARDVPEFGLPAPEAVGSTFLVAPGNRGQVLARVDLHVAGGPLVDAVGPDRAAAESQKLGERIAKLEKDLAGWEKDPNAEAAFVARNREDLAKLKAERDELAAHPLRVPERGSWMVLRQIPVKQKLPCDPAFVARKQALDAAIGDANRKAAAAEKPAPPPDGKPGYAGIEECGFCHKAAVEFWKTTRHAHAFATIEAVGKQWNRDCIGCHVTGWMEPGGSTLGQNDNLRNVQCEVCHGPASKHVDKEGHDKPPSIVASPSLEMCASRCHTPEHSDTFQIEAYLRDVTGPGHAAKLRQKLGDGPTGHELRAAALAKAGKDIGANCPK